MNLHRPIPNDTQLRQKRASDPRRSVWVSAHAGSGKTYVLTSRVVRLLLARVPPSRILCLTYTKAAAANMSARVFDLLASWALLEDDALRKAIVDIGAEPPSQADLVFARRLFARTVETPGGLKIQTIHAFCERVLHLFPFEANVSAGFRVVEELERAELLQRAKHEALARAAEGDDLLQDALTRVAAEANGQGFDTLLRETLQHRGTFQLAGDFESYGQDLRGRLGLRHYETVQSIEAEIVEGGLLGADVSGVIALLRHGSANDCTLAEALACAVEAPAGVAQIGAYLHVFFTKKGDPRGVGKTKIITKGLCDKYPALLERLEEERDRLGGLVEKRKAALTAERSLALARVGDAVISIYERMKRSRGLFDFDDLIERMQNLLQRCPSWALYKLDQQVDHILLDEAQDTSAPQWDILASIADEFCSGASARALPRTFFAVGDEKQSIFSFQGAAPEKFDAERRAFERRFMDAGLNFEPVRLTYSFRSAPEILKAVDDIFLAGDNKRGLSADETEPAPEHAAVKADLQGLIEIWDLIEGERSETPTDWRLPLDLVSGSDPGGRLAKKIALKIKALLAPNSGESVEHEGGRRPVAPGDIMILVRKRDSFFEAMIRALKSENIPVAGADRLILIDHIAVMDLIALGRAALLRDDDLTLATVLKSPLVGLNDDDLIAIAPHRVGSLFESLQSSSRSEHQAAARQIEEWARDAAALAPFDFYSRALGAGGGRKRMIARLGAEANDAIDEFLRLALDFEREQAGGLTSFLANIEGLDLSIKRDMEGAGAAVRVMTVHAAKGLEAKIVFLPDTCGAPSGKHDPKLFALGQADNARLAWSTKKADDPAALVAARERLRRSAEEENQRLLYVALTRAEERLYIAGWHGARAPGEGCWYHTIRNALEGSCDMRSDPDIPERNILFRGAIPASFDGASPTAPVTAIEIPEFARTAARRELAPAPPLRPSNALDGADVLSLNGGGLSQREGELLLVGRLTHALLQHLPHCARERRPDAARRFLSLRASQLGDSRRAEIARQALAVMEDDALAPLFGPASAAEVDIVARIMTPKGELPIAGRIDRLAETEQEVFIADFKSGRPRASFGPEHLRQLALYRAAVGPLYPGKRVRCVLVFTQDASVAEPSEEAMDAALRAILDAA